MYKKFSIAKHTDRWDLQNIQIGKVLQNIQICMCACDTHTCTCSCVCLLSHTVKIQVRLWHSTQGPKAVCVYVCMHACMYVKQLRLSCRETSQANRLQRSQPFGLRWAFSKTPCWILSETSYSKGKLIASDFFWQLTRQQLEHTTIPLEHATEIPTIMDPSATEKYPSAAGSIIVGISVQLEHAVFTGA